MTDLKAKAKEIRKLIFKTICNAGGGHLPTCLSMTDLLTVLYYEVLRIDPKDPRAPDRDRFILSKGHGGVALYVILADKGFFDMKHLATHGKKGTILGGHPDMHKVPGIEASTGALGHGLSFGVGTALAAKKDGIPSRTFVVIGDGECQEGSVWEAALFAAQARLDNLTVIVDHNKLQAMGKLDEIVGLASLAAKWRAFGWAVTEIDGHDLGRIREAFKALPLEKEKPNCIIAHTVKGKGISFMENVPIWHYRQPKSEEMQLACDELGLRLIEGVVA
jgi:transketolase